MPIYKWILNCLYDYARNGINEIEQDEFESNFKHEIDYDDYRKVIDDFINFNFIKELNNRIIIELKITEFRYLLENKEDSKMSNKDKKYLNLIRSKMNLEDEDDLLDEISGDIEYIFIDNDEDSSDEFEEEDDNFDDLLLDGTHNFVPFRGKYLVEYFPSNIDDFKNQKLKIEFQDTSSHELDYDDENNEEDDHKPLYFNSVEDLCKHVSQRKQKQDRRKKEIESFRRNLFTEKELEILENDIFELYGNHVGQKAFLKYYAKEYVGLILRGNKVYPIRENDKQLNVQELLKHCLISDAIRNLILDKESISINLFQNLLILDTYRGLTNVAEFVYNYLKNTEEPTLEGFKEEVKFYEDFSDFNVYKLLNERINDATNFINSLGNEALKECKKLDKDALEVKVEFYLAKEKIKNYMLMTNDSKKNEYRLDSLVEYLINLDQNLRYAPLKLSSHHLLKLMEDELEPGKEEELRTIITDVDKRILILSNNSIQMIRKSFID